MPPKKKKSQSKHLQTSKTNVMKGVGRYRRARPGQSRLTGRGGYAEDIGSSIGSWLGKKAGGLFRSITGLGTYAVTKNSLMANPNDPPVLSNTRGGTRIQHREYIQDIFGSSVFTLQAFPINPGIPGTFPWLSGVAANFEEYILHGLVFEFKSTSATALNSTNTALGTVIQATEYNVTNPPFVAKRDMENYVYSTSCSPDVSALHPVECARDVNVLSELFTRNTVPASGSDLRFSDIGLFQIATVGMQAAANIGELWVTYDIELIKPKLANAYTSIGPSHFVYDAALAIPPSVSAPTASNFYGSRGVSFALKGTGNSSVSLDVNTMTFTSPGRYMVIHAVTGTGGVLLSWFTETPNANAVAANIIYNGSPTPSNVLTSGTTNNVLHITVWDILSSAANAPGQIVLSGNPLSTEVVIGVDLFVIPLPIGFTLRELSSIERLQESVDILQARLHRVLESECKQAMVTNCEESDSEFVSSPAHSLSQSTVMRAFTDVMSQTLAGALSTSKSPCVQTGGLP